MRQKDSQVKIRGERFFFYTIDYFARNSVGGVTEGSAPDAWRFK